MKPGKRQTNFFHYGFAEYEKRLPPNWNNLCSLRRSIVHNVQKSMNPYLWSSFNLGINFVDTNVTLSAMSEEL